MQISHPNDTKENWITGSEYLSSIILNNTEEYTRLNSAKKASKGERNLFFSGYVMLVKFNSITSSLKYSFVKGFSYHRHVLMKNLLQLLGLHSWRWLNFERWVWLCGRSDIMKTCKHIFAILYYVEYEANLGYNKVFV